MYPKPNVHIAYLQVVYGIVMEALRDAPTVILYSLPYLGTLAAFAAFIAWNGGVVLGM
jgi:hypothetical protein